jgi:predicted nucleotidyltransferase
MLELSQVDLDGVATALDDHSDFGRWWIDGQTGEVWRTSLLADDDEFDPDEHPESRPIDPAPSRVGYEDMQDFIDRVGDRRAVDLLARAIEGRGAFRRFKDTLFEFPQLREQWFAFHDRRMKRRAIEFLTEEQLVARPATDRALASLDDIPAADEPDADPRRIAGAVADDLRAMYGERLVDVVLYGSRARGDDQTDSDLDLAVVLDEMSSAWDELRRMDDILWKHTLVTGVTVSVTPITRIAWSGARQPLIRAAKADGVPVG